MERNYLKDKLSQEAKERMESLIRMGNKISSGGFEGSGGGWSDFVIIALFMLSIMSAWKSRKEIVGYLGPNGAGKSTTIKMMTGVLEPTSGEILVNGIVPYKNVLRMRRR